MSLKIDSIDTSRSVQNVPADKHLAPCSVKIDRWVQASQIFFAIGIASLLIASAGFSGILFHLTQLSLEMLCGAGVISLLFSALINKYSFEQVNNPKEYGLSGIKNTNNNCWLNAMLQVLLNSQSLKKELPTIHNSIKNFMAVYKSSVEGKEGSPDSQPVREFLSTICTDIQEHGEFQDLHEPLNFVLDSLKSKKNILSTTNHFVTPNDKRTCSIVKEPNNGILNLPINTNSSKHTLKNLLNDYFRSAQSTEVSIYEDELKTVSEKYCFGLLTRTRTIPQRTLKGSKLLVLEERKLAFAPNDLFLNIQRYLKNPDVLIDFEMTISGQHFATQKDEKYILDSFAVHTGYHYVSYVLKDNIWFCCDDNYLYAVSEKQAKKAAKKGYILHYKKV